MRFKGKAMKKLLLVLIVPLFFCISASAVVAAERTFTWSANIESDLAGYKLYQSSVPGQYVFGGGNEIVDIPAGTEIYIENVSEGLWYFVLTAYDTSGNESGPSNEVSTDVDETAPSPPGVLQCFVGATGG